VSAANQAIVGFEPWTVAKDPKRKAELEAFLHGLLESVRLIAILVYPVMPSAAGRIFQMLGLGEVEPAPEDLKWGQLEPGTALGKIRPLFPRIQKKKETPVSDDKPVPPASKEQEPEDARIDISEFAKVELRVAQVKEAEKLEGSKKLLKLQVDLGTEVRQVVAGIAQWYEPGTLVGRKVVVVTNLKPAKLFNTESNGMILAASPDDRAVLLTPDQDVPPGTKIR
jgi:methionyl-tRNA synthetase